LLPELVIGNKRPRNSRFREPDLESLTSELVQLGLASAGPTEDNLHAKIVNRVERELIAQMLVTCDNVQIKAAAKLGINRNTLHKKLKEYGLEQGEGQ
jgi:DNA-binding protein Fis